MIFSTMTAIATIARFKAELQLCVHVHFVHFVHFEMNILNTLNILNILNKMNTLNVNTNKMQIRYEEYQI